MAGQKTISQRIALEGGREILEALRGIGAAGEKAFKNIGKAAKDIDGAVGGVEGSLRKVRLSFERAGVAISNTGKNIRQFGYQASLVSAAVGAAVGAIGYLAKGAAENADAMGKAAQQTGLTIEQYGALQFAAEQGDVAAENFGTAMARLSKLMLDAKEGGQEAISTFREAGVEFAIGGKLRPTGDVLADIADKIAKMKDGAEKTGRAMQFFGRSGAQLVPLLNGGSKGLAELEAQAKRLGLTFTDEQARIGDEFGDSLNLMLRAFTALKDHIGLVFVPALTGAIKAVTEFIANNREAIIGFFTGISDAFDALPDSVKLAISAFGGLLLIIGPVLIALGTFVQVIGFATAGLGKLVVGLLSGLRSVITFGAGVTSAIVKGLSFVIGLFSGWGIVIAAVVVALTLLAYAVYRNWDEIKAAVAAGVKTVTGILQTAGAGMIAVWQAIGAALLATWQAITAPFKAIWNALVFIAINAWNGLVSVVEGVGKAIVAAFRSVDTGLRNIWKAFVNWFENSIFGKILNFIGEIVDRAVKALERIREAKAKAEGASKSVSAAGGGYIRGAGTGTSDSIPAWLSDGEFVIRAAAVRKYGADFLSRINAMRAPGFAAGGLVGALPALAFANGGSVSTPAPVASQALAPVILNFPDASFSLLAPREVASALSSYSVDMQTRAIGRRSSAWGGG